MPVVRIRVRAEVGMEMGRDGFREAAVVGLRISGGPPPSVDLHSPLIRSQMVEHVRGVAILRIC